MVLRKLYAKAVLSALAVASVSFAAEGTGTLRAKVEPGRAGVFVDGKYVGPAANFKHTRTYALAAGPHEIRLSEPRYEDVVKNVTIEAGKKTVLTEAMKPLPPAKPPFGILRAEYPDHFAAVYVNSRYMGHVDEFSNFAQGLKLNPGTYEVKIVPVSSGTPLVKTVTIEENRTVVVK